MVNIGAETTEISVLSLGGIVISKTAESLKKELGSAVKVEETFALGFGRNVLSGLPVSVDVSSDVVYNAIVDALHSIMDAIKVILERTPPELAADIIKNGVYVSGLIGVVNNPQFSKVAYTPQDKNYD